MKMLYFNPHKGAVAVKNGFSWPAFLFGSLWAVANHMWNPYVFVLLPIEGATFFLAGYAQAHVDRTLILVSLALSIVLAVVRGRFGNRWLVASLRRRGYSEQPQLVNAG